MEYFDKALILRKFAAKKVKLIVNKNLITGTRLFTQRRKETKRKRKKLKNHGFAELNLFDFFR